MKENEALGICRAASRGETRSMYSLFAFGVRATGESSVMSMILGSTQMISGSIFGHFSVQIQGSSFNRFAIGRLGLDLDVFGCELRNDVGFAEEIGLLSTDRSITSTAT